MQVRSNLQMVFLL